MDKDITPVFVTSTIGEEMVNPNLVKLLQSKGFYVVRKDYMAELLKADLELAKIKGGVTDGSIDIRD